MTTLMDAAEGSAGGGKVHIQASHQFAARARDLRIKMFRFGSQPGELHRCLTKIKKQLVVSGARADNLPTRDEERAEFAASLPEKASAHIRVWFTSNANFDGLPSAIDACQELAATQWDNIPFDRQKMLWRAILADHCRTGGKDMAKFLSSETNKKPSLADSSAPVTGNGISNTGIECQSISVPLMQPIAANAENVRLAIDRDELGADCDDECFVLAQRTNVISGGQIFIHVHALYVDGTPIELGPKLAEELFPERGDAIGYRNALHVDEQAEGSLAIWRVVRKVSNKSAHFVATEFNSVAYEVSDVPYSSTDPDNVRNWIQEVFRARPHVFPIFQLQDGLYIKLPADSCDPGSANFDSPLYCYKQLRCYHWHGRRIVVGKLPLPDTKFDCAPPRTVVKRLLGHPLARGIVPGLTRAQVGDIADAASQASTDKLDMTVVKRAVRYLEAFAASQEQVSDAIEEILQVPSVVKSIEAARQQAATEAGRLGEAAKAELVKLAAEKKQLQADIEKARQTREKETAALGREVRQAFERAGTDGMKTLASLALFKNALGLGEDPPRRNGVGPTAHMLPIAKSTEMPLHQTVEITSVPQIATAKEINRIFSRWYFRSGLSSQLLCSAMAAAAAAGLVTLRGSKSSEIAAVLARSLSGGAHATMSISGDMFGLGDVLNASVAVSIGSRTQAMTLGDLLDHRQRSGETLLVRLKGANRMPPESYLPELLAACRGKEALSWIDRKGNTRATMLNSPVIFLAEFSHGRSVFPVVPPLCWDMPLIDTDAPWHDSGDPDADAIDPEPTAVDPQFFKAMQKADEMVWRAPSSLPLNCRRLAERMVYACIVAGMTMRDAAAPVLFSVVNGRVPPAASADFIRSGGGSYSSEFGAYATSEFAGNIFDMGTSQ